MIHWKRDLVDLGLPEKLSEPRLYYTISSSHVLLHAQTFEQKWPVGRLFFRQPGEQAYVPIGSFAPNESVDSVAVALHAPVVVYTVSRLSGSGPDVYFGNDVGLFVLQVDSLAVRRFQCPPGLRVATAVALEHDGSVLYCIVGVNDNRGALVGTWSYFAALHLEREEIWFMDELRGVFY